ncbi:helix-turn-helix transcriptional regulator [Halomontanus rarus]|uniref:helix-turn-helix transcriptional regulator n=1 Tax=Halomontanus rarus TaxID=3034020 RepID=UPI0023E88181|nr:ArsR family transcriptional regulator [Halovivax sp. TS33]
MNSELEEIEFLALSANRVAVLDALQEGTYSRRDLEELTGASQPTLGRILRDFDERNWIARTDEGYEATATGRLVAAGITDLTEIVATELKLRDVVHWLPTDELDVDLRAFRDATITVPTQTRPSAPVQRTTDLLRNADRVRIVSYAFNERSLEIVRRRTLEDGQTFEGVFSAAAIEALADDDLLRRRLRELVDSERAEIRVHDGPVPLAVTITEGVAQLLLRDEDGVLQAALDAEDPRVLSWAREAHERYWTDGRPLEATDLGD